MKKVFDISSRKRTSRRSGWAEIDSSDSMPDLPVLPSTVLQLELSRREKSLDLKQIAEVIRQDLGAVAHVFNLCRSNESQECYSRLEDCICSIPFQDLLKDLEDRIHGNVLGSSSMARIWLHSAEIAEKCQTIASQSEYSLDFTDAWIVGLFHELVEICGITSQDPLTAVDPVSSATIAVERWGLPKVLLQYLRELQFASIPQIWTTLVEEAHRC